MRILITGGAGFQGSHLSEFLLEQGHDVTILNTFSKEIEPNIIGINTKVTSTFSN